MSNLPSQSALIGFAIGAFFLGTIFFLPIGTVDEVVTDLTNEPLAYQGSVVRETQVPTWIFWEATEVQYMITNRDVVDGTFTLNFVYDNGKETKSSTRKIKILAGVQQAVTQMSAFHGVSKVTLYVVPPYRVVARQRTVPRNITLWDKITDLNSVLGR